jgi:hypothetical protein
VLIPPVLVVASPRVHDAFTYLTAPRADVDHVLAELTAAGAVVIGTWAGAPGIGWWDDEIPVLAGWPGGSTPIGRGERLRATARPSGISPLGAGGLFAHRWFELASSDWDEFLALSSEAWPAFEREYGATIEGFFRSDDVAEPDARVLLVTRYPSLTAWEQSRGALRNPTGDVAEAGRRFLRRRELTRRTIVRTGVLR